MRRALRVLPLVVLAFALAFAPAMAAADPPGIKWVAAKPVHSLDGQEIYDTYCAACHRPTGRGNGPAVRFLSVPVPDLTKIGEREGKFSISHVKFHVIDRPLLGRVMPDWEDILLHNYSNQRGFAEIALHNLAKHLQRMQVQSAAR
jgi:hypothetical protein